MVRIWKCNWTSSTRSHCRQQIPMASPDQSHTCKSTSKKLSSFSTATYQHRYQKTLLQRSHKISHRLCVSSVGWLWRGTLKKLNFLHRRAGKLILPDPSLSTEQKTSALWILNLPQQLAYNKGIFMHKVLNNNSPNYLAQLFISHQSHYTNSRNNLYVPRPRLNLFETSISFDGASLWNSLSQNIKSCISLPCFKRNLHKYSLRITFRQVWTDLFESHVCLNKLSVVYMYAHERNLILMFLHIRRNYESALINCLIVLIIFVCGIVVFISCYSKDWLLDRSKWT